MIREPLTAEEMEKFAEREERKRLKKGNPVTLWDSKTKGTYIRKEHGLLKGDE